jgi:hypothetical protein
MWDKDIKMFLNTIRENGQRVFTATFYFQSSVEPKALFEKTLLKMAKQLKHMGTVGIKVKPCQYLDTTWEIMFFNFPYYDAIGLCDYIRKALVEEKHRLIHRYPKKFPQMTLGHHFKDFEMVCNFVKNMPWWSREEKGYHPSLP